MKITIKIGLFAFYCLITLPPTYAELRAVEECDVKKYKELPHMPLCFEKYGEQYAIREKKESIHCGEKGFERRPDMSCPGSVRGRTYYENIGEYDKRCSQGGKSISETRSIHDTDRPKRNPYYIRVTCRIPNKPATCAKRAFGVIHKSCRHEKHKIVDYKPCEDKSFGVDEFFECEIRKTRNELEAYFQDLDANIDLFGKLYFSNNANMFKLTESPTALACFIKKWEDNPLTSKMVNDLKNQFIAFQGIPYTPSFAKNCDIKTEEVSETDYCEVDRESRLCLVQKALNAAEEYLVKNEEETRLLQDDVVARKDPVIKERLHKYNELINHYLNQ